MKKFIIDNVIIDKSEKDIQTGVNYQFDSGFNLICGDNEAGKSSLMYFMKEGFFLTKGIDTGKIFFSLTDDNEKNEYRADIKNSAKKNDRCKIYESASNSPIDYSLIEANINEKYFKQGFTINLDDLMSLQTDNNISLVNVIKDPSGDKLNMYLSGINSKITELVTSENKPKKPLNEIKEKINSITSEINALSQMEAEYNDAVNSIKQYEEKINLLTKQEEYLNYLILLRNTQKELNEFNKLKQDLEVTFNSKLFSANEKYVEILHKSGKYESNTETIKKLKPQLEEIEIKLKSDLIGINKLITDEVKEEDLINYNFDGDKIAKIKEITEEISNLEAEKKNYKTILEDTEFSILKYKNNLETLTEESKDYEIIEELKEINKFTDDALSKVYSIGDEISEIDKKLTINAKGINSNKIGKMVFGSIFLLSLLGAGFSFYFHFKIGVIFAVFFAILCAVGYFVLKVSGFEESLQNEREKKEDEKAVLLNEISQKLKIYFPEIVNVQSSYLMRKIESLKQEIFVKLQNYKVYHDKLAENIGEITFFEKKFSNLEDKIKSADDKISQLNNEFNELVNSDNLNFKIPRNLYLDVMEYIKSIKNAINEKQKIIDELKRMEDINNSVLSDFKNFITENDVNIPLTANLNDNVIKLHELTENNNKIKKEIDLLNVSINNLNEKYKKTEELKNSLEHCIEGIILRDDKELQLEEVKSEKKNNLELRKDSEFKKRRLEAFEGITNLKNEKNILLQEYRNKIQSLFINKMVTEYTLIAKNSFDKNQPDLLNAQKYLSLLTDGKYSKIDLVNEQILNEDNTVIKNWNELSRGTKEQVYLALRLGYASNYTKDKTTMLDNGRAGLPVIVDDAFVNFDFGRTKNALKCLMEFSKTNQIMFFTCHTDLIKNYLKEIGFNEKENYKILYIK